MREKKTKNPKKITKIQNPKILLKLLLERYIYFCMPSGEQFPVFFLWDSLWEKKKLKIPKNYKTQNTKKKYCKDPVEDMYKKISF